MDEVEQHRQALAELMRSLQKHPFLKGTAEELVGQFGYSELRPDVAEYVEGAVKAAGLTMKPSLTGAAPDTKITTQPQRGEFHQQFPISEEPATFIARMAMVLGKKGYTLRTQSEANAIFNREETKWVGIAFGGTKKTVKTILVQFSPPDEDRRTVTVQGDDGRLAPAIYAVAAGQ